MVKKTVEEKVEEKEKVKVEEKVKVVMEEKVEEKAKPTGIRVMVSPRVAVLMITKIMRPRRTPRAEGR